MWAFIKPVICCQIISRLKNGLKPTFTYARAVFPVATVSLCDGVDHVTFPVNLGLHRLDHQAGSGALAQSFRGFGVGLLVSFVYVAAPLWVAVDH